MTGIVRKIDELGRIVIPKELRKNLNINTGDDFQIYIEDEKIILEKFSYIKSNENVILKIIKNFMIDTSCDISLIINGVIINKDNQQIISKISNIIKERKKYVCKTIEKLKISENIILEGKYIIMPIVINGDLFGTIIIVSKDEFERMEKNAHLLLKIIKSFYE